MFLSEVWDCQALILYSKDDLDGRPDLIGELPTTHILKSHRLQGLKEDDE